MKQTSARVHDLVAKTARVTIKDTLRVMLALRLVADHMGCAMEELVDIPYDLARATPEQAEACLKEFEVMCKVLNDTGRGGQLKQLRVVD